MLERIVAERSLEANAVFGLYPAASVGDDIEIYRNESREEIAMVWHCLRQQSEKASDRANLCLADFVAPKASGVPDYIGAFAVTAGIGVDERVRAFEAKHDDYSAIMFKALADRLAEAFTELLHERVRREYWGYAAGERLSNDDRLAEKYRGIRPAPGYPACPDHTEKGALFDLLDASEAGITLTESYAMLPAASVSGFYLSHPDSRYFAVDKIGEDQAADYARRKALALEQTERWLAPNLAYEP
jgi:5-methyltetrahydrofolate--homocysteine methyltransferase